MSLVASFPDIEALLVDYLPTPTGVDVFTRVPTSRPGSFVRVERSGGPRLSRVSDQPIVLVESWAATESAAIALASNCRTALADLEGQTVDGAVVYAVEEVSGPGNLPDPLSNQDRYTQTFSIHLRGT